MVAEAWAPFGVLCKKPLLAREPKDPRGRPPKDDRLMLNAILWIVTTGAPWRDLPKEFGPWQTAYKRFAKWAKLAAWDDIFDILSKDADKFIEQVHSQGSSEVIPPKSSRRHQRNYDHHMYRERHLVECFFAELNKFRRVAIRYEKLAHTYRATAMIAACLVWLQRNYLETAPKNDLN
jgi:transposase